MRYSPLFPLAVAALFAACNDSPVGPDAGDLLRGGAGGRNSFTVSHTAAGLLEDRTEYDWTAQRYVSEIHVGSDMHLVPEVDRVQILPGETVWITFQVDARRRVAYEATVEGVRGQTCVTNTAGSSLSGFEVLEQVQVKNGSSWVSVAGATVIVSSSEALEAGAMGCLPYEILFDADPAAQYRVVATVSTKNGQTSAEAAFTLPTDKAIVEIDAQAWVQDKWWGACRDTFGLDFSCMSLDTFPRDRLLEVTANGHASVSFMVDLRNDGVCGQTYVYTLDAPLRESGPTPPGGEQRPVSGSVVITTGICEDLKTCPQSDAWWAARLASNPAELSSLLPIVLGIQDGAKTFSVVNLEMVGGVFNRYGDPSNGILELYAQLLTTKLNIRSGADPRPSHDIRMAVDVFLSEHRQTDWTSLTASEQAQVREWAEALEQLNERGCPPDDGEGAACTRTIGYWKTHAGFGPQADVVTPLLPVWLGTAGGAKSIQVTTAALAVSLLDRSGDPSNGINKLYAQLLAARLNIKNGADGSPVLQTIALADTFLAQHGAADWGALSSAQRQQVLSWMSKLDDYNNGRLGTSHCN